MRDFLIYKEKKEYEIIKKDKKINKYKKIHEQQKMQKDKKMQRNEYRGSYTVEAAILVPCIIFFLMAMLYTFFFFHDLLVVEAQLSIMALQEQEEYQVSKGEEDIWEEADDRNAGTIQKVVKEKVKKKINKRTCVCNVTDITAVSSNSITLSSAEEYEGIVRVPVPMEGMREWVRTYIHQREMWKVKRREYAFCKNVRRGKELCKIVK